MNETGRDAAVEKWLREKVVAVYDAMEAERGRSIPAEVAFSAIRARHADRISQTGGKSQG